MAEVTPQGWKLPDVGLRAELEAAADAAADRTFLEMCSAGNDFDPLLSSVTGGDPGRLRVGIEQMGGEVVHRLKENGAMELAPLLVRQYPALMIAFAGSLPVSDDDAAALDRWLDQTAEAFSTYRKRYNGPALCAEEVK